MPLWLSRTLVPVVHRVVLYAPIVVLLFIVKKSNNMAEKDVKLMKGNEVIAHAAVRCGCDVVCGPECVSIMCVKAS